MILYSKDKDVKNTRKDIIENEKNTLILMIDSQNVKKGILSDTMQRFANYADTVAPKDKNDSIAFFLNNFKNSLAIANTNIFLLNNLLNLLNELLNIKENKNEKNDKDDKEFFEKLDKYNVSFMEANEIILNNTIQIEQTLSHILSFSELAFDSKNKLNNLITNIANKNLVNLNVEGDTTSINVESISEVVINESLIQEFDKEEHPENTLVVSEKEGIVLLPFTLREINTIYSENRDKYTSFKQIIEEKFTVKFDEYKNPALARFREAFKLMRIKEKASVIKAFELGMELFFNYNLHPAIISACKSLDELDIYLDYLEDNETHKFDCFKIIFDMAPIEVKSNKLFGRKNKKDNLSDKETAEEILAVELESQTLDLEDIKEEIETENDKEENKKKDKLKDENKKSFDTELNSTSMNIKEIENISKEDVEVTVILNKNSKSKGKSKLRRNEDYNLYENMMEETTKKVNIEDSKFKDVNDTISIVEDFMNESTLEMPEVNKIVVPKEVKKKRVTKSKAKVKVSKDSKKEVKTENKSKKNEKKEEDKSEKTEKPETKKVTKKVTKTKIKADDKKDKKDNKIEKEEKAVKTTKTKNVVRKKVSKDA